MPATKQLSPTKRILFTCVVLFGIPILFFTLCEVTLQFLNYGGDTQFIKPGIDDTTLVFDPLAFDNWLRPRKGMQEPIHREGHSKRALSKKPTFVNPKPASVFRVICLGASTTQGFPHYNSKASFPELLRAGLSKQHPSREIEVLNMGISGVNSFIIREELKQLLKLKPDLFILYMGHNEFSGYLGSASNARLSGTKWMIDLHLWLARFKSYVLLQDFLYKSVLKNRSPGDKNLISFLPKAVPITPDMPLYQNTVNHFKENLEEILDTTKHHSIPLIPCTLVSNLENFVPFQSFHHPPLSSADEEKVSRLMDAAWLQFDLENKIDIPTLHSVLEISPNYADAHFLLGKAFALDGKHEEATQSFSNARDLDGVKLRAPKEMNKWIQKLSKSKIIPIADLTKRFNEYKSTEQEKTPLILEHVHPSVTGNALIADTLIQIINRELSLLPKINSSSTFSLSQYAKLNLLSEPDSMATSLLLYQLLKEAPFHPRHQIKKPEIPSALRPLFQHYHLFPPEVHHLTYARYLRKMDNLTGSKKEAQSALFINEKYMPAREFLDQLNNTKSRKKKADFHLWQDANRYYDDLIKKYPDQTSHFITRGFLYFLQQKYPEANQQYQLALQVDPLETKALMNTAKTWSAMHNQDKAKNTFQKILSIDKKNQGAHTALSFLAKEQGDSAEALSWLQSSAEKNPANANAQFNLGVFHAGKGDFDKAATLFNKAVDLNPNYAMAWFHLGLISLREGRFGAASMQLETAIRMDPYNPKPYARLARAHLERGNRESAKRLYERALIMNPGHIPTALNLGGIYLELKQMDKSLLVFRKYASLYPNDSRFLTNLGTVYLQMENFNNAQTIFEEAKKINPQDPLVHFNLAATYQALNNPDKALQSIQEGLALKPGDPHALRMQQQLQKLIQN